MPSSLPRLEATVQLLSSTFLTPILIGDPDKIHQVAKDECLNINSVTILQPHTYDILQNI